MRPPSFSASFTLVRMAAKAGSRPQMMPVKMASARAKAMTLQSRPMLEMSGRVSGSRLVPTLESYGSENESENAAGDGEREAFKQGLAEQRCARLIRARDGRRIRGGGG